MGFPGVDHRPDNHRHRYRGIQGLSPQSHVGAPPLPELPCPSPPTAYKPEKALLVVVRTDSLLSDASQGVSPAHC